MLSQRARARLGQVTLAFSVLGAACTTEVAGNKGTLGVTPTPTPTDMPPVVQPADCNGGKLAPGPSPLRRLTRFEFNNTVRDLLGDDSAPANTFPLEEQSLGFDNDANVLKVSQLLAEAYVGAAQQMADKVVAQLPTRLTCAVAASAAGADGALQEQCAGQLIDQLAPKAYRRQPTAAERERLLGTYRSARGFLDFGSAAGAVLESLLLAPQFLYRVENSVPLAADPTVAAVDAWGLASRLSYYLWASMPDDELFHAAAEGRLSTAADVRAQAERMYGDARSRNVVRHFNNYWLDLSGVDGQRKDPALFPDYTPEIGPLLREQTQTVAEHSYFDPGGTLQQLLTAPYSYMNQRLASFYGVTGPTGTAFEKVELDPKRHAGLLTDASTLSWNATADRTNPILRGVFIRRKFLCDPPPPPPPGVTDSRGTLVDPNATERQRLEVHRKEPTCAACHQYMDPVGLAFENFDASGRWRDLEVGKPVDATGHIQNTDVDGDINGPVDVATHLAQSQQVKACVAINWFRFANGRGETETDQCSIKRVNDTFAAAGGSLRELVLSLTQTDAFLYRAAVSAEAKP